MFRRFTQGARACVLAAQTAATDLEATRIEPEHLLLGLLGTQGVARRVLTGAGASTDTVTAAVTHRQVAGSDEESLRSLGIDLTEVRRRVEDAFGPGALDPLPRRRRGLLGSLVPSTHLPFGPAAKRVLAASLQTAVDLRHDHIGTEHVLLAVLQDQRAAAVLQTAGVRLDAASARAQVLTELRRSA